MESGRLLQLLWLPLRPPPEGVCVSMLRVLLLRCGGTGGGARCPSGTSCGCRTNTRTHTHTNEVTITTFHRGLNPQTVVVCESLNVNYFSSEFRGRTKYLKKHRNPSLIVTHNDGLFLFRGVLDGDAFDLLVEALHAVAETRRRGLGYRDGYQDGFGHRRLRGTKTDGASVNVGSAHVRRRCLSACFCSYLVKSAPLKAAELNNRQLLSEI